MPYNHGYQLFGNLNLDVRKRVRVWAQSLRPARHGGQGKQQRRPPDLDYRTSLPSRPKRHEHVKFQASRIDETKLRDLLEHRYGDEYTLYVSETSLSGFRPFKSPANSTMQATI